MIKISLHPEEFRRTLQLWRTAFHALNKTRFTIQTACYAHYFIDFGKTEYQFSNLNISFYLNNTILM